MVRIRLLLGVFLFSLLCSGFVRADSTTTAQNDPGMDVSDPGCELSCPNPIKAGQGFTFTTNASGGGIFQATNAYAETWDSLLITFSNPGEKIPLSEISCSSGEFGGSPYQPSCSVSQEENGDITDLLYQDCPTCEVPSDGIFSNDIFTVTITLPFPAGLEFDAFPNANKSVTFVPLQDTSVPEPATLALFGSGLAAVFTRVRRKAR